MDKRKKRLIKELITMSVVSVFSAVLYAIAINCLINLEDVHMLSNGIGGISLIIARLLGRINFNEQVVYAVVHFGINLPIMILAYKQIGKLYALFSFINNSLTSLLVVFIPSSLLSFLNLSAENDMLVVALLAGLITGCASGLAFKTGFSTGGIDTLIAYFGIRFNKQVGKYSIILNGIILLTGGFLFHEWRSLVYTLIMVCVCSVVIDFIYTRAKKRIIKIITTHKEEVVNKLIEISRHGITVTNVEGGYSHSQKHEIETAVLAEEVNTIIYNVKSVDKDCFIYIIDVFDVRGRYTMPTYK